MQRTNLSMKDFSNASFPPETIGIMKIRHEVAAYVTDAGTAGLSAILDIEMNLHERQVQARVRTHLIHRPARDIFPPLGGTRVSSYRIW